MPNENYSNDIKKVSNILLTHPMIKYVVYVNFNRKIIVSQNKYSVDRK